MTNRTEYIDRLRKMADLLEATPDLVLPNIEQGSIRFWCNGAAETAATAKLLPTGWEKNDPNASGYDADYYRLTGEWEGSEIVVVALRNAVCERVIVGTETSTVPAVEATPETVEERPVYEFKCEPLLAKAVA